MVKTACQVEGLDISKHLKSGQPYVQDTKNQREFRNLPAEIQEMLSSKA